MNIFGFVCAFLLVKYLCTFDFYHFIHFIIVSIKSISAGNHILGNNAKLYTFSKHPITLTTLLSSAFVIRIFFFSVIIKNKTYPVFCDKQTGGKPLGILSEKTDTSKGPYQFLESGSCIVFRKCLLVWLF